MHNDQKPVLRPGVEVHHVEDGCVVYVPDGQQIHFLNETAAFVLDRCDGQVAWGDMQAAFEEDWGPDAGFDVRAEILPQFEAAGIIAAAETVPA
jgi:hypothetical protein